MHGARVVLTDLHIFRFDPLTSCFPRIYGCQQENGQCGNFCRFDPYYRFVQDVVSTPFSQSILTSQRFFLCSLTRLCRARFERDDILEAQVVCGTGQATEELIDEGAPTSGEGGRTDLQAKLGDDTVGDARPWRLPFKLNFTYATMASRQRQSPRHLPNPFGPPRRSSSTAPLNTSSPTEEAPLRRLTLEPCREASNDSESQPHLESNSAVVTKHHPHRPWEDESSLNHTYENPYYTRSVDNLLWLPRGPSDILSLDDTVDLRMSLTTQPGAGRLGAWREEDFIESGFSIPFAASIASLDEDTESTRPSFYRRLDGTEQIQLPPMIASRVNTIDQEDEI